MQPLIRQGYVVFVFSGEGPGKVFARFSSRREAEEFCVSWQKHDQANLYAVGID